MFQLFPYSIELYGRYGFTAEKFSFFCFSCVLSIFCLSLGTQNNQVKKFRLYNLGICVLFRLKLTIKGRTKCGNFKFQLILGGFTLMQIVLQTSMTVVHLIFSTRPFEAKFMFQIQLKTYVLWVKF